MGKPSGPVMREALDRQGKTILWKKRRLFIPGGSQKAEFEMGGEGLVQLAIDEDTKLKYRIKCFWEPHEKRLRRSQLLAAQGLADLSKSVADALGGAPFGVLGSLGPNTPFAVIMKNVGGMSWQHLRENASVDAVYPPREWPTIDVRATWAYGLATAVRTMESRGFVHADFSPGNVMLTASGETTGDMALVDFDSFIHPSDPEPDRSCRGTPGFAAPEIHQGGTVGKGTDRLGMAILIQEFLCVGDPSISKDEAFSWSYDQETELISKRGEAHPLMTRKYPALAELVRRAIAAPTREGRPTPNDWRPLLKQIVMDQRLGPRLRDGILVPSIGPDKTCVYLDAITEIDLQTTPFAIRVKLQRDTEGRVSCVVHAGADVRVQHANKPGWLRLQPGTPTYVSPGMVLFDREGKIAAKVVATEL